MSADLDVYLAAAQPFDWQRNNCAHFAAGWVLLASGRDVPPLWSALMRNTRAALRHLHRAGGRMAATAAADEHFGQHLGGLYAARGDVVLLSVDPAASEAGAHCGMPLGMAWGVCTGGQIAALGVGGVVFLPLTAESAAWRVWA